jgi:hypothetical protein
MILEIKNRSIDFGELISTYRGYPLNKKDLWWIIPGLFCFLLPLGYGIWLFRWVEENYGLVAAFYRVQPWILLAYLAFLSLATLLIYRVWASRRFVSVFEKGIRWRLKGIRIHSLLWEELNGIASATIQDKFAHKTLRNERQSILYPKRGAPVVLDERLQNLPGLVEEIKKQFYPQIYPELLESFHAGQEIRFGPIAIQNQSIRIARIIPDEEFLASPYHPKRMQKLPWSQSVGLTVHSGFLVVQSGNSMTKRIPVSQIPNFEILLKMIEQGVKT